MTLQLLYECYTQLSAHVPMWDKIGLSKPCNTSLRLEQLWEDQLFEILMMVDGGDLMPSLVVHDGFHVLYGDLFLEMKSCLHCILVH